MMYLALAVIWGGVGAFFFVWHASGRQGETALWLGGLAVLMGLYDLVRWWGWRTLRNQRRGLETPMFRHRPLRRPGDDRDPDPTFRFTDQPAESPPSANGGTSEPEPK